ncbi:anion permease [Microlunatus capsulatus]|uniref:Phosphate transporter n=1 Tax=Microlunatus capsulatus TaxID=99117 RepID=A0ABS4Z3H5_9ACTN|nr:inorganic phosphate transporter [Microlunatus capsulatus]MBP2415606.1 PiT family inorganic phosphate transporter [Microlunatus capsulatus]
MTEPLFILAIVIATALVFDFTNGFHDTANAMATSIATGALKPKVAVALSAVLNLVGAFLSIEVALTVSNKVVNIQGSDGAPVAALMGTPILTIVFAGLVGGILWNLATWLLGLPSSSSHALFGGLIGSAIAALGLSGVKWDGVISSIVIPAVAAPVVAGLVAAVGTRLIFRTVAKVPEERRDRAFRWGQIGSASLVSLAHGTNDAQKTMGVITLALIAYGSWTDLGAIPFWVKAACALAIAAGTYIGGWRVIRTLGKGLVEISSPQGMAAETASAAIILSSSHLGMALSTTHVATGSILGTGLGRKGAEVRWAVAGRMAVAWVITLPAAAVVGALCWGLAHLVGGWAGVALVFVVLVAAATAIFRHSRKNAIDHSNVNADWDGGLVPAADPVRPTVNA